MPDVPAWVRPVAAVSVALVAVVAAVVSYAHMHDLAESAGEGWRAWLLPLSVDGLLLGESLVLYVRAGRAWLAWSALFVGIGVSLVANVLASRPELVSRLVAAWPAVALALSYEVLLTLVKHPAGRPVEVEPTERVPVSVAERAVPAVVPAAEVKVDRAEDDRSGGGPGLLARARQVVHQVPGVGRGRLARHLGVGEHAARQLLDQLRADAA